MDHVITGSHCRIVNVVLITAGALWVKVHNMSLTARGILQDSGDTEGDFSKTINLHVARSKAQALYSTTE